MNKKMIEEWKKKNGNSENFTMKEMIQGIHAKLDKFDERFLEGEKVFATKEECARSGDKLMKMILGINATVMTLLGALAYYIIILRGV